LLSSRGVHLPAQADLNADDIKYISDIIKDYVAWYNLTRLSIPSSNVSLASNPNFLILV